MAISVADNFSYKGSKPLDARVKYSTVADMKDATTSDLYDGCFAYVTATKKYYSYDSSNTVDETTGKWREYSGGGSGASSLSDLTDTAISSPSNGQALRYNETTGKWENADIGEGGNAWTDVTGTLTAGSTSLTLTDSAITTDALYDFYTSVFGLHPTGATVSTGSIVLTFEEQSSNVSVTVRVYDPNATGNSSGGGHVIEDNGTELTQRDTLNLIGFDAEDDSQNEKTQVSAHRLTSSEMEEIFSVGLPGAITGFDLSNTSNEANIHSTDERVIGQWIDGKPLYQKTITLNSALQVSYNSFTDTDVSATTVEQIVCAYGYDANGTALDLMAHTYGKGSRYTTFALQTTRNGSTVTIVSFRVQYTKTTDSAVASGEKIVGQWVDGRPIFEKVITLETAVENIGFTINAWTDIITLPSGMNVDYLIDVKMLHDAGTYQSIRTCPCMYRVNNNILQYYTRLKITDDNTATNYNTNIIILRYTKS